METPETSQGCSQENVGGKKPINSKMTQRCTDRLTEALQTGDKKTDESGAIPPLQTTNQYPISTCRRTLSFPPPGKQCCQSGVDLLSDSLHKKEQKPKKTGKYVCHYCGRACAKPSVLKKHIRSHTGERPYPCVPCGFSFKTKSNLYKHRKSHTHAVKAGLVPFSEQDSKNLVIDEELTVEGDLHSDAEQSTDTDEETTEDLTLDTGSSINIKNRGEKEHVTTFTPCSSKKETVSSSGKVSLWQFREMMAPAFVTQVEQEVEPSTVKQRLALRLSEKRSQESDQSLTLPSSYSKGSTDSGYFSRSESAEQQFSQPSSSAKSYQEIMFGKCYRPSSKPRQSITVQTCMTDINESTSNFMIKLNKGMAPGESESQLRRHKKDLIRSIKIESESFQEEDYEDVPGMFQCCSKLLQTSESGLLLRSNSLPTSSNSNLNAPQGLRSSNSFDERMTNDEMSYRGSIGMRRLMRQAAFEHSGHEGHAESDHHTSLLSGLKTELKMHILEESKFGLENCPDFESSHHFQSQITEIATRKRRKGKNIIEDEDLLTQSKSSGDIQTNYIQDFIYTDSERVAGSNVISVIQHTNALSGLTSGEKATDLESHQTFQILEKVQIKERQKTDHSSKTDRQWGDSNLFQRFKKHVPQPGIQVPEIRVTEEPDKPEKGQDVHVKSKEKHGEEFQWPQRSETLSKFPVEKLPPKKKRLRLAEMECSSGESSFESACTSLSRSPSQDSNLSHSSSFSQSLDREEIVSVASPAKSDEFNKPLEFLSVPGGSQIHPREMRRSASEQAPCNLPMELPEFRSKSFDYGYLSSSSSSMQCDIYASASGLRERRRGFLVRQASLSGDPETVSQANVNAAQGMSDTFEIGKRMSSSDKQSLEVCSSGIDKMRYSLIYGNFSTQQLISTDLSWKTEPQMKEYYGLKHEIKIDPGETKAAEDSRVALTDLEKVNPQSITNVLSSIAVLSQAQPALASQRFCGLLVPVRIQMQVPSNGKITYTSISHILDSQSSSNCGHFTSKSHPLGVTMQQKIDFDLSQISGHPRGLLHNPQLSPAKIKTGIPLSLTSRTISTTEAPSGGANKRMLSPASSTELFIEAKQQKRGKDEKMYGQIVEELSAVELGHPDCGNERFKKDSSTNVQDPSVAVEEVDMENPIIDCYSEGLSSSSFGALQETTLIKNVPMSLQITPSQGYSICTTASLRENPSSWILSQFPGLHTTTSVSWCYLNSAKPNSARTAPHFSVYASWFVRCYNPNPPNLSTAMVLSLLRSKQKRQNSTYTVAAMYQPGIFVTSTLWSQKQEQGTMECKADDIRYDRRIKDIRQKSKALHEDNKDTGASLRPAEPIRVKIFEGGYKSNEDYVYVRGRGRGKYICEECGIRCKKPSMLKKHIRTHTDVRPYICKSCNFAFKTKGNLTKHMKSKAHMKKCLELGVSSMTMDITDDADHEDDVQKCSDSRLAVETTIKHQFSDAEDSEGGDEDGDEPDDEEDDEYDGDSTPRTLSRSTSPQPCTVKKPFLSSCFTKSLDTGTISWERPEAPSPCTEDNLNLEQASTSFDPYSPHLLSPCWESQHQRYISPRADLSPQSHLSPGRDTSPLRAISPRRDLNLRGDLSPIRQLSPVRPISPGTEVSRPRAPSPRGRNRGMLRAASPRRGSYQHRAYVDQGRGMRFETSSLRQTSGMQPEMEQRDISLRNDTSNLAHQDIFSHLPLHSQRRVPAPIPMVPIGGLRMPSISPCGAADTQSESLRQGELSERADSSHTSIPGPGPGVSNPSSQHKEKPTSCPGLARRDRKQEESVHSCAEAIASLRITSEEIIDKPPKS